MVFSGTIFLRHLIHPFPQDRIVVATYSVALLPNIPGGQNSDPCADYLTPKKEGQKLINYRPPPEGRMVGFLFQFSYRLYYIRIEKLYAESE